MDQLVYSCEPALFECAAARLEGLISEIKPYTTHPIAVPKLIFVSFPALSQTTRGFSLVRR